MENIKSICCYNSAYELFEAELPEKFPLESEDMNTFFLHVDDFEGFRYYLINGDTVIMTDGYWTMREPFTVEEIYNNVLDMYLESIE